MAKKSSEADAIIADIKHRSGPIKVAECDDGIVLDAEALCEGPAED